jgi:hypothetical protein
MLIHPEQERPDTSGCLSALFTWVVCMAVAAILACWIGTTETRVTRLETAAGITIHCGPAHGEWYRVNAAQCPPAEHK